MFQKNKAQVSMEFMIIVTFSFVLLTIIISTLGLISVDMKTSEINKQRDDFASLIIGEFELATQVEKGYTREFTIKKDNVESFNVSFNQSFLILRSKLAYGEEAKPNYYLLPEGVNYHWTINQTSGDGKIILTTNQSLSNKNIHLLVQ